MMGTTEWKSAREKEYCFMKIIKTHTVLVMTVDALGHF